MLRVSRSIIGRRLTLTRVLRWVFDGEDFSVYLNEKITDGRVQVCHSFVNIISGQNTYGHQATSKVGWWPYVFWLVNDFDAFVADLFLIPIYIFLLMVVR